MFDGAIPQPVAESYGPTVSLEWGEEYDFPDVGTMTVKFRVKRREEYIEKTGKKRFEICLELLELQKMKTQEADVKPANSLDDAGAALDALRAESEDED